MTETISLGWGEYAPFMLAAIVAVVLVVTFAIISTLRNRRLKRYLKITNQTIAALNEELMRSKEEADKLNAYRAAFIENLTRELKTPINTIDDFTSILLTPGLKPEEIAGYGKIISHSAYKCDSCCISNYSSRLLHLLRINATVFKRRNAESF